jgi:hypothetical protein
MLYCFISLPCLSAMLVWKKHIDYRVPGIGRFHFLDGDRKGNARTIAWNVSNLRLEKAWGVLLSLSSHLLCVGAIVSSRSPAEVAFDQSSVTCVFAA